MKKESIFTKEGVFGCDVFNLRFWKLRRSTLLREVVSAAVEIRRFLRRSLIFQRQEKAGGFFTAVRKNKSIFVSSKADRRFQNGREKHHYEFFFQMCRSCSPSSLIRHSQSSRWFFSVVLLEDVIVEDWGGFTNSLPREGPGNRYCDQILTVGEEKMLERRRRSSSSGWDVAAALFYILGSAGFLIRMVSNK